MAARTLYYVTVGTGLAQTVDAKGAILGDPKLSPHGSRLLAGIAPRLADALPNGPAQVHCGSARRFFQALPIVLPHPTETFISPLWGESAYEKRINGRECVVLDDGTVIARDHYYDHLPKTERDPKMELWHTSTFDSVFNLPADSVILGEKRTLFILGLSFLGYRSGALYHLSVGSVVDPIRFRLMAAPPSGKCQAA